MERSGDGGRGLRALSAFFRLFRERRIGHSNAREERFFRVTLGDLLLRLRYIQLDRSRTLSAVPKADIVFGTTAQSGPQQEDRLAPKFRISAPLDMTARCSNCRPH